MVAKELNSSDPGKRLFSELPKETPCLSGESSSTIAGKSESTAPSSETKANTDPVTSFDRRTRLLIDFGLIQGITPTSIRKQFGAAIPDFVSSLPVGENVDSPKKDC
jgi:hypothetical protein